MVHGITHGLACGDECRRVCKLEFDLLSDDELRAYSVVSVENSVMYTRGIPSVGGINDLRMGTTDHRTSCGTCGNGVYDCPGHVGHIELPLPVVHGMYVDTVLKTLRVLCFWCARPKRELADGIPADARFAAAYADCRGATRCVHCHGPQPHYARVHMALKITWVESSFEGLAPDEIAQARAPFTPVTIREIFTACDDADVARIGLHGRPENMVPSTVVVPPPVIRPAIVNDARCRGQDDLTHILQAINKKAIQLRSTLETIPQRDIEAAAADGLLVTTVYDRDVPMDAEDTESPDAAGAAEGDEEDDEDPEGDHDDDADQDEVDGDDADLDDPGDDEVGEDRTAASPSTATTRTAAAGEAAEVWEKLQGDVAALFNNTSRARGQTLQRSGAPTRTLKHRLTGKHGRIRENIQGKRTNQSARSVISPDPTLDLDEIGIPRRVAMILTVPEPVNASNISRLTQRVRNGPGHLLGAASVVTRDGCVIDLEVLPTERRMALTLRPAVAGRRGDVVERFLTDGVDEHTEPDVVVFNRQPSLHKFSMMGHRVRVLPGYTLRMSELAAKPYNADFDGDEMNVHVPQSAMARAEVSELMMVSQLIMSPQGNRPVVGLVQDSLLGAYLLSDPATTLTRRVALDILHSVRHPEMYPLGAPTRADGRYTGAEIVSVLLPSINLTLGELVIQRGRLLHGRLDKRSIGASAGGIVQVICQDFGSLRAARFLSDIQSVVMRFLAVRGFSMGICDCIIASEDERALVDRATGRAMECATSVLADKEGYVACGVGAEAERAVLRITSGALSTVGKVVGESLAPLNALNDMVTAGSKGNPVNYTQIMGCVGQNCVEGGRICVTAARTLPCFKQGDDTLEAHGFVENSYIDGLTPPQLFFHAMGGREGLVDTAVRTAQTGYLQRRTIKGLEEKGVAHVPYHPTHQRRPVLSAKRAVIQLHYGGDGCDGSRLERVALPCLLETEDDKLRAHIGDPEEIAIVQALRARLLRGREGLVGVELKAYAHVPVCARREVEYTAAASGGVVNAGSRGGRERRRSVDDLCTCIRAIMTADGGAALEYTVRYWLCLRELDRYELDAGATRALCVRIRDRVAAAAVSPGEMVGIVTAQSFGEPLTQMTLNTFHLAGVGGGVTQGIGRIKELIDVTKKPKTPVLTLPLVGRLGATREAASRFAQGLPRCTLGDICLPHVVLERREAPPDALQALCLAEQLTEQEPCQYVICGILHAERSRSVGVYPEDVARAVRSYCPSEDHPCVRTCVCYTATAVVVGVSFAQGDDNPGVGLVTARRVAMKLYGTVALAGVAGIAAAHVEHVAGCAAGGALADTHVVRAARGDLQGALAIDGVDWRRATSNNVIDVQQVLGVEAARTVLMRELYATISYDGTYISMRHIALLVDSMCHHGYVMPMSRHGINREKPDETLKKCSYEETMEVLANAAAFGHTDNMDGVTPSVAFGQHCTSMGTAASSVYHDKRCLGVVPRRGPPARGRLVTSVISHYSARMVGGGRGTTKRPASPLAPRPAKIPLGAAETHTRGASHAAALLTAVATSPLRAEPEAPYRPPSPRVT